MTPGRAPVRGARGERARMGDTEEEGEDRVLVLGWSGGQNSMFYSGFHIITSEHR